MISEGHRQLAERCVRLAKECSQPKVAAYLMTLAASYVEMAELAVGARQPGAVRKEVIPRIPNCAEDTAVLRRERVSQLLGEVGGRQNYGMPCITDVRA